MTAMGYLPGREEKMMMMRGEGFSPSRKRLNKSPSWQARAREKKL
jgi:hypothetical protein